MCVCVCVCVCVCARTLCCSEGNEFISGFCRRVYRLKKERKLPHFWYAGSGNTLPLFYFLFFWWFCLREKGAKILFLYLQHERWRGWVFGGVDGVHE